MNRWKLKYHKGTDTGKWYWFVYKRRSFLGIFSRWEPAAYADTEEDACAWIKRYPQPDQKVISL